MKEVEIRIGSKDVRNWQDVLSVYLELYKKRVFRRGSGTYNRMVSIMLSLHYYNHYTL